MNPKATEASELIFAPNVYLCSYHLRDEKTEGKDHPFWQNCDRILSNFTSERLTPHLDFSKGQESARAILMREKLGIKFSFASEIPEIEGYAQPLQIQDSYALFFNIGYDEESEAAADLEVSVLQELNPQNVLLPPKSDPSKSDPFLGQTLLLTAWLTSKAKQQDAEYLQKLANACYAALLGNDAPLSCRKGELFGSSIFEYGRPKQTDRSPHILIWLFRDKRGDRALQKCFESVFDLLLYRAKITKAFKESRVAYSKLKKYYSQFKTFFDRLQDRLDAADPEAKEDSYLDDFKIQLKQLLQDSLPYSRFLSDLEDFGNTIEINLYNYNEQIAQIRTTIEADKEEISFLEHFGRETAPHFRRQIEADLGYFEHGTELVDRAIASIRGIVEIDQAKRDRDRDEKAEAEQKRLEQAEKNLQDQIQAIGVGVGAGAIFASTASLMFEKPFVLKGDRLQPHPFIIAVLSSAVCAILFWAAAKLWLARQRRSGEKNKN